MQVRLLTNVFIEDADDEDDEEKLDDVIIIIIINIRNLFHAINLKVVTLIVFCRINI